MNEHIRAASLCCLAPYQAPLILGRAKKIGLCLSEYAYFQHLSGVFMDTDEDGTFKHNRKARREAMSVLRGVKKIMMRSVYA